MTGQIIGRAEEEFDETQKAAAAGRAVQPPKHVPVNLDRILLAFSLRGRIKEFSCDAAKSKKAKS